MSRSLFASAIVAMMFVWSTGFVMAQQTGTAEEAKAMFDRAVAAVKADEAKALSEFNDKNNKQFHDRDLYVFCYNMSELRPSKVLSPIHGRGCRNC
jgi:cytochrome c